MIEKEKLTQVEIDKINIDPDFDFKKLGEKDFEDLSSNEIAMFKWSGVYHQLQTKYFMIRLRMPAGVINSLQLKKVAELAKDYGQNSLCISTRQCFQFHWVSLKNIHKIIEGMEGEGILTKNACGDVCRNVTSCSLQGVCKYELVDTRKIVDLLADDPVIRDQKRNLPRKHKISVGGCNSTCALPLMNCQAWLPVIRSVYGKDEVGWSFYAGGGLGSLPHLAKAIFDWVPEELLIEVARATIEAHNRHGNRRVRRFARLKIIVEKLGYKKFAELILEIMKESGVIGLEKIIIASSGVPEIRSNPYEGVPVIPQKQEGLSTIRVIIKRSEVSGDEALWFANLAENYGDGEIALTVRQNLEIRNIPNHKIDEVVAILKKEGYRLDGLDYLPDVVACVGTTMCNLAVSNTPEAYRAIVDHLGEDEELWRDVGLIKVNITGCPNSCAHHWVSDIGLRGKRIKRSGSSIEGFSIFIGGKHGGGGRIAEFIIDLPLENIVEGIREILDIYLKHRVDKGELFSQFTERVGIEQYREYLSNQQLYLKFSETSISGDELSNLYANAFKDAE